MKPIIYKLLDEAQRDAERFYERAEYYYEQGNISQALDNYVDSLAAYANFVDYRESALKEQTTAKVLAGQSYSDPENISYRLEDQINFLFEIAARLLRISNCYDDTGKGKEIAYCCDKVRLISEELNQHQKELDVKGIEHYNVMLKSVRGSKALIAKYQDFLDNLKKVKPINETDETFKKIRVALLTISETKICLVPLESNPGCFIATAAYSTSIHPDLDTFRTFRDDYLLTHRMGQKLVDFYYQVGPSLAQCVEKQPAIKRFVRQQLERLAKWMRSQGITS